MNAVKHTIPSGAVVVVAHNFADLAAVKLATGEEAVVFNGRAYLCKNAGMLVLDLCVEELTHKEYLKRLADALPPKGGRIKARKKLVEVVLGRPHHLWW